MASYNSPLNHLQAKNFASALHALASFYETHPEFEAPYIPVMSVYFLDAESIKAAAALPGIDKDKDYSDTDMYLKLKIPYTEILNDEGTTETGFVQLNFHTARTNVCTKKVTGKKLVAEQVIPGYASRVIPEHEEDVVEWDCHSLLAPEPEAETLELPQVEADAEVI